MIYPSYFKSPDGREIVGFFGNEKVSTIRITENRLMEFEDVHISQTKWERSVVGGIMLSHEVVSELEWLAALKQVINLLNKKINRHDIV